MTGTHKHYIIANTPKQITNLIENWFTDNITNKINLIPPILPKILDIFIDEIIPLLQKKNIFHINYHKTTLQKHYNLEKPDNILK